MGDAGVATRELQLLSDPTRARIISLILEGEGGRALVGKLADQLGLRQPTVSHHLRALLDDGILEREPDGRRTWYSVAPRYVERLTAFLAPQSADVDEELVLRRVVRDLTQRYSGTFNAATVEHYVRDSHAMLGARVGATQHLGSLTARFAGERLDGLASSRLSGDKAPHVLFVCVHNSGRSQMAAAILRQLAGNRIIVRTAGSEPATAVKRTVLTALEEIGVPLAGEYPKPLTDEAVRAADLVITMGCGDVCPIYPGVRYIDWDLPDPAGMPIWKVRDIRDKIEARVRALLDELLAVNTA